MLAVGADDRRLDLLGPGRGGPLRGAGPARPARLHRRPERAPGPRRARRRDRRLRVDLARRHPLGLLHGRGAGDDLRRGVGGARRGGARRAGRARAGDPRSARPHRPRPVAGRRRPPDRRPPVLRRPPAHAPTRRSRPVGLARDQPPAGVARRHPLGDRRRGRAHRGRGIDPAQRVARLRRRLAAAVAREQRRRDRRRRGRAGGSGLAADGRVTAAGVALRQRIEDDTDRLTAAPWARLGREWCERFAADLEPPCEHLLARVDLTAGENYQPASRIRPPRQETP